MIGNAMILLAGLAVYAGYGLSGLALLVSATLLSYLLGLLIPRYPSLMWAGAAACVLALAAFRFRPGLTAPLGFSYFSLQMISYLADVYQEKYRPTKKLLVYALYITYIPHIFIGPIEPFPKLYRALRQRRVDWDGVSKGAARLLWGVCKRLLISARIEVIVSAIAARPEKYRGGFALTAVLLYSLQLYSDFSGGMDIVLGGSRILGVCLSENFDRPFFSRSPREFWARWHITLGEWLRDYVYIPLGGNRRGKARRVVNVLATFLASGLWHGVHYLLWGLFHGILACLGERLCTRFKTFDRLLTALLVSLMWAFFVWPDTSTALKLLASVFTVFNYHRLLPALGGMGLTVTDWVVVGVSTLALWVYDWKREALNESFARRGPAARTAAVCTLALIALVFGRYGFGFHVSEFIYSRF